MGSKLHDDYVIMQQRYFAAKLKLVIQPFIDLLQ